MFQVKGNSTVCKGDAPGHRDGVVPAKFSTCEIIHYWAICACVKYFARDRVRVRVRVKVMVRVRVIN